MPHFPCVLSTTNLTLSFAYKFYIFSCILDWMKLVEMEWDLKYFNCTVSVCTRYTLAVFNISWHIAIYLILAIMNALLSILF